MGVLYQSVSQPYRPVSTMLSLLSPLSLSVVGVKHSKPWKFFSQFDVLNAWTWLRLPAMLLHFTTRSTLLHCENSLFFAAAHRGIWLHYMVLVRMNLIWLSDLLNNNQTAVGIRVLTDRAKCCPTQVLSASAQWCQWCPTVVTRADCPGPAEDLTWLAGGRIGAWWDIFGRSVLPHLAHRGFGCAPNIAMWIGITQIYLN